jgi:hypothetical protein
MQRSVTPLPSAGYPARLGEVPGGFGGVGAAGWGSPFQDAGFGLLEVPAVGLFGAVVVAA